MIEKINIHAMLTKMIWYRCSYNSRKVFHDLHLLITSTIWIMNGSYDSQILRCKNEQLRISIVTFLYENTRFLQFVDNSFFAYPSNDRRYFIIQRLKSFSCMHTLFCYVTSIKEMRSIRHSKSTLPWWRVNDLFVKADEMTRFLPFKS